MSDATHWDGVYGRKSADEVSWFQPRMARSIELIERFAPELASSRLLDVGGGASTLVDELLGRVAHLTVMDLSAAALEHSRARLGERASSVTWRVGDITTVELAEDSVDVWHDRAVFHFLRTAEARRAYVAQIERALVAGGLAVMATFSLDGPERCSGLEVCRYSAESLLAELGAGFSLLHHEQEAHVTPSDKTQSFVYAVFRRA